VKANASNRETGHLLRRRPKFLQDRKNNECSSTYILCGPVRSEALSKENEEIGEGRAVRAGRIVGRDLVRGISRNSEQFFSSISRSIQGSSVPLTRYLLL
jgi:hypothetical protein